MLDRKMIERLSGWEGYRAERIAWPDGRGRSGPRPSAAGGQRPLPPECTRLLRAASHAGVAGQIRAVAIDMTTAYELEIQVHCPNAEIVYDLFHVVAKYGREVIDRARVDQANQLRHDKPACRVIKSSCWLLLRNPDNLDRRQAVQLDELLEANRPLLTAYLMRDELKRLWFYRHPGWARKAREHWLEQAQASGIAALTHFAFKLKAYLHGILSRCRPGSTPGIVEGINNTIKAIKRRACGYRDQEYFFLKIHAAFPDITRWTKKPGKFPSRVPCFSALARTGQIEPMNQFCTFSSVRRFFSLLQAGKVCGVGSSGRLSP